MAGAKSYFIPHTDNGHWPHLLRHHHLAKVSAILILLKVSALGIVALTPTTAYLSTITASRIVQLTNDERKKIGASTLTVNSRLTQAAQQKGQDMLANQYFAHISPSGVTPWFWMKKSGYSYSVAGENLAIDFVDAEDVVTAWLNSPTHKANMLSKDYTETGVAVVSGSFQGGTSIVVVHMFGLPQGSSAPAPQATPTPAKATPTPTPVPIVAAATSKPIDAAHGKPTPAITPIAASTATPEPTTLPTSTPAPTPKPFDTTQSEPSPSPLLEPTLLLPPEHSTPPSLLLSPAFDRNEIALLHTDSNTPWQVFSTQSPITLDHIVITTTPSFSTQEDPLLHNVPFTILSLSRKATAGILITVAILLSLAMLVRIRIQHPALITHASLVIILASILLIA